MGLSVSKRSNVAPFYAMDVLAKANRLAANGHPVISMAVGQPSDPAPEPVREAARRALRDGRIGYTDSLGIGALRGAIADHYSGHYGISVPLERVIVTTGSSAAFNLAFLAMFDPGQRVAITTPGYPAYRNILQTLGLEVVEIALDRDGYLKAERLQAEHEKCPIDGLLFASPANPTGAVIPEAELSLLISTARALGIALISDEIYHRLNFVGPDRSALGIDGDTVVINSFSKYYCMTGWRIGWMVVPERLVRPIERIQQSLYISAPELSQIAAVKAFDATADLEVVKQRYRMNRDFLMKRLPDMGLTLAAPMDGAFYAYCDVSRFTNDSMEFADRMITDTFVAATPGQDFDPAQGQRYMRFSYAGQHDHMVEATDRLESWLKTS
jgi:aspartate/methionine/tyrosine aminotransferase